MLDLDPKWLRIVVGVIAVPEILGVVAVGIAVAVRAVTRAVAVAAALFGFNVGT